jgi:hypothetical protein
MPGAMIQYSYEIRAMIFSAIERQNQITYASLLDQKLAQPDPSQPSTTEIFASFT